MPSVRFAPGRYDFFPADAIKLKLHISNSNDDPYTPKAVAMLFKEARHTSSGPPRTAWDAVLYAAILHSSFCIFTFPTAPGTP